MIYGDRIRFRRAEKDDLPLFMEWINDPEVIAGLTLYLPMGMWEEEEWFAGLAKRPQAERPLTVEIPDGDSWRAIGNVNVFNIDAVAHSAEVGIMLGDKSIWNQGYGTEAMRLLLKHGFPPPRKMSTLTSIRPSDGGVNRRSVPRRSGPGSLSIMRA